MTGRASCRGLLLPGERAGDVPGGAPGVWAD